MTPAHLFMLAVIDIYGHPDTSWHFPRFIKFSMIGLAIRSVFWVLNQLPKQNPSPRKPARKPASPSTSAHKAAPAPEKAPPATEILVLKDGQQLGPFALEEIKLQLSAGNIMASDLAWQEGMAAWEPLASVAGVVAGPVHGLRPPPPPMQITGWSAPPAGSSSAPSSTGMLVGGYICAGLSLLFLPPVLGLAGIVCGVIAIKRQQVNKGVALLIVSSICTVLGMMIGAAMNS